MVVRVLKITSCYLALICVLSTALVASAQVIPAAKAPADVIASKWDIFVGYSYLSPKATVPISAQFCGSCGLTSATYSSVNFGQIVSISRFFNRNVGVQAEVGVHEWGIQSTNSLGTQGNNDGFTTVSGGLVLRYPTPVISPFAHALFGGALVDGPYHNPFTWGPDVTVGGGLDYATPWLNHRMAIRLVQGDYEYMHVNFGSVAGGSVGINAARVSAGVVFHIGEVARPTPVSLAVSVNPATIFAGDPITATAVAEGLTPKLNVIYIWSGAGVTGNGSTATISTASLAPGTYTVKAIVEEGKAGKEGLKPWQMASASTTFTVKAFEPPTISCSASPSTIKPGESSEVIASGVSPQNRKLTYSYSATAGTISGNGASATFSSVGAPTGSVGITCSVSDDKGQTATANSGVTITAPYVAPMPRSQSLCSISFAIDKQRPTRVDNEAKACLDEVAIDLQRQSDAKAVMVGTSNAKEKAATLKQQKAALKNKHLKVLDSAAERAVNAKDYLVKEKGIDAARISVATSAEDGQKVADYLVPSGASFNADVAGTTPVDEAAVKAQVRKPLGAKPAYKKSAAKPGAVK
jgi:hypothetical protein